ncbi:MAG: cytochrome b/b6 domain-containing protein [Bacteroidales bacterium]|jgi:formate dehydrogenase gamma subunit|nr:cytochrome b/b6 domain-containing protein [Bacteroidales bacterium]HOL98020.1 cytochrome b/b6 domain-containing protein [Bacteroidales bacterium]HOM36551.1 cytochrome b/b6 domain-containing protein [Bacteroidales bacterium]HPD23708.1 cytochrome b/b6 domain-containing protein [Bacteroidales bacterium]HRS99823.1 cytochrome b/b6 domain-containing protein [Bacteroidales bacterium]
MKKVYIYKGFERFWHWTQSILIFTLAFTGFEVNGAYEVLGYETAVNVHNFSAISLIILIIFAIFWHFTTGEWKQYIPTKKNMKAQIEYYITGIFRNAPHPTRKTILSKLNPLQRLTYLALKIILIPLMVITGILYMLYRYGLNGEIHSLKIGSLEPIAILHTIGAFLILAFVIAHIYLTTTGHTPTSNIKAMITGWEELEDEDDDKKENNVNTEKNEKNENE